MKKLFLFAIIMLTSLSVNAQESGDSVKSKKIDKIKICKSKYEDSMKGEVDLSFRLNVGGSLLVLATHGASVWV